jgi:hypothetical protein
VQAPGAGPRISQVWIQFGDMLVSVAGDDRAVVIDLARAAAEVAR